MLKPAEVGESGVEGGFPELAEAISSVRFWRSCVISFDWDLLQGTATL